MDEAGMGTDTSQLPLGNAPERRPPLNGDAPPPAAGDPLLAGVRRMTLLADHADGAEAIFRTLARELLGTPGADEIHVYHLAGAGDELEQTVVYLFVGEGRLS
jgi:hypothetical protein